jgi:hypothetical protein
MFATWRKVGCGGRREERRVGLFENRAPRTQFIRKLEGISSSSSSSSFVDPPLPQGVPPSHHPCGLSCLNSFGSLHYSRLPLFWKKKLRRGLWDHLAVCVSTCLFFPSVSVHLLRIPPNIVGLWDHFAVCVSVNPPPPSSLSDSLDQSLWNLVCISCHVSSSVCVSACVSRYRR